MSDTMAIAFASVLAGAIAAIPPTILAWAALKSSKQNGLKADIQIGQNAEIQTLASGARLIAAGPEMLDALKAGRQKLVTYTSIYSNDKQLQKLLDTWDEVIAKAERQI